MKKSVIAAWAVLMVCASAFADGFNVSGYVRAGLSSTFEKNPSLSTKTWLGGIYFNGDSPSTRGRINLSFSGSNTNGTYGAFLRLQYTGTDDSASSSWGYGTVSYANAYAGFLGNKIVIAAGKLNDTWIISSGFEGFSVLDGKSGAAVTISPVAGLNITGAGIIDYSKKSDGTYDTKGDTFLGGAKYATDAFTAAVSGAGYGLFTGNFKYTGVKNLIVSVEGEYETTDGRVNLGGGQELLSDVWVEYKGLNKWTFGVLSFQYYNRTDVPADNDFTLKITPAVAYQINNVIGLSLEGTYVQSVYDNAPGQYATIVPAVKLNADSSASVSIWTSISTDNDQAQSSIGLGVIKSF
jgi:hypothetical protein